MVSFCVVSGVNVVVWVDVDDDGDLDFFVFCWIWCELFLCLFFFVDVDGQLKEVLGSLVFNMWGYWESVVFGDFDRDGDLDFVVVQGMMFDFVWEGRELLLVGFCGVLNWMY